MQNTVLKIDNMEGEACADNINRLLGGIDGVRDVRVSLRDGLASVQFDEVQTSPQRLTERLAVAGYPSLAYAGVGEPAKAGGCCGGCCRG